MRFAITMLAATLSYGGAAQAAGAPPPKRDLELKAPDGVSLKASFFASDRPGPGVLLLHQCGNGGRQPWDGLGSRLAAAGVHVLTLDYRGFGESGGERYESADAAGRRALMDKWPADFDIALQFLLDQPGVDRARVGAGGASCGVDNSIRLSMRHPEVKAVVALSGMTFQAGLDHIRRSEQLRLFAASSEDDFGFVAYMRWMLLFSRNPWNKLVEYARAGHGTDMFAVEKDLEPQIVEWLVTALQESSEVSPATASAASPHPMLEAWTALTGPDGVSRASRLLEETRRRDPGAVFLPELAIRMLAYEHQQSGDAGTELEVLRFGVEAYPGSPMMYDRLASLELEADQPEKALEHTRKALQLLDLDTTLGAERKQLIRNRAQQRLKRLQP